MITDLDKENLTHMTGTGSHIPTNQKGYRNYFCATVSDLDPDYQSMVRMELNGLVLAGRKVNDGNQQYFYATEAGCKAIGLTEEQTKRVLE